MDLRLSERYEIAADPVLGDGDLVQVVLAHDRVLIDADGPVSLVVCGIAVHGSSEVVRDEGGWKRRW